MSTINKRYTTAITERAVPGSVLVSHLRMYENLPPEEEVALKEKLAEEIEAKYPYKKGKGPTLEKE